MGTRGSRASSLRERRRLAANLVPSIDPLTLQGILVWRGFAEERSSVCTPPVHLKSLLNQSTVIQRPTY